MAGLVTGAALGGAAAGDYTVVDNTCTGATVPQNGTCSVGVRLTPTVELAAAQAEAVRAELAPRFRSCSLEDLTTLGFWLHARKGV